MGGLRWALLPGDGAPQRGLPAARLAGAHRRPVGGPGEVLHHPRQQRRSTHVLGAEEGGSTVKGIMFVMVRVPTRALLALDQRIHSAAMVLAAEGPASVEERIHQAAVELAGSGLISVEGATDFITRLVEPNPMARAFSFI